MRNPFRARRGRKLVDSEGNQVTSFPPQITELLRLYGGSGSYAALYRAQPNVRTVIDFLASEVSGLKLKVYGRVPGDTPQAPSSRIELDDDPLQLVLNRPSGPPSSTTAGRLTRYRMWQQIVTDIGIYDTAYLYKVRDGVGRPAALVRYPVSSLRIDLDPVTKAVRGYRDTKNRLIDPNDLVIFDGYDPESNLGSVSPMETLRRTLAEEYAMGQYREWMWRNGARRDGIIQRPADAEQMSDDALEAFLADFAAAHSGASNSGKPAFLDEGMTWKESQFNAREAEYIKARLLNRAECAAAFGVPASLVGAADREATADVRTGFYSDRLAPLLSRLEEEIDVQLLPEFEVSAAGVARKYTRFNLDEKLRGSFESLAAIGSTVTGRAPVSVNEWRARLNLPSHPDGDGLVIPMNVSIGGQAAPTAPLDTPAEGVNPAGTTPNGGGDTPKRVDTKAKRAKALPAHLVEWQKERDAASEKLTDLFVKTFQRQERSYRSVPKNLKAAIDWGRYDRELASDLNDLSKAISDAHGARVAAHIGSKYTPDETVNYVKQSSKVAAENINRQTREALAASDDAEHVFEVATGARGPSLGRSRATTMMNFAAAEAARQSGGNVEKTWIVTSARSRHPELNGETVPIDQQFSNGLDWPGDSDGTATETARCQCLLEISNG